MIIEFTHHAWDDLEYWLKNDKKVLQKILKLLSAIKKNPTTGIGKPELLKYGLKGCWSRRITEEHRLVYKIEKSDKMQRCIVLQCRFHYEK